MGMKTFTPSREVHGQYDTVVIGGGVAGVCAAIAAARIVALVRFLDLFGLAIPAIPLRPDTHCQIPIGQAISIDFSLQ